MTRFKRIKVTNESGFTLIELMIATIIFSVVLILVTVGIIQITRTYYKGITTTRTDQAARSIMDEISQAIQFSGGTVTATSARAPLTNQFFCAGSKQFSYRIGQQVPDDGSKHGVVVSDQPPCTPGSTAQDLSKPTSALSAGSRELLPPRSRLVKLVVNDQGSNLWSITVRVAYGDDDLLCSPSVVPSECNSSSNGTLNKDDLICKNYAAGTQFCAVSELSTVVQKRIK